MFAPYSSATSSTTVVTASSTSLLEASMEHCSRPSGMSQRFSPAISRSLSTNHTVMASPSMSANDATFWDGFGRMAWCRAMVVAASPKSLEPTSCM